MEDVAERAGAAVLRVLRHHLMALACAALLLLLMVGVALVPLFGIGVPVLAEVLALVRSAASWQRRRVAADLGVVIPDPYPPDPPHPPGTVLARVRRLVRASATWRDLAWLVWHGVVGGSAGAAMIALGLAAYAILTSADSAVGYAVTGLLSLLIVAVALLIAVPLDRGQALMSRWWLAPPGRRDSTSARIDELTRTRATTVDARAAELRRIERDLHDGVQARLVSLGLSIGLARAALPHGPTGSARADALLVDAQQAVGTTLDELRALIRGIHPPVLAERGLAGAVEALALTAAVPVGVTVDLPERFEPAVESAMYFAAAEALTNLSRHAHAENAHLELAHHDHRLELVVVDDGVGGADPERGSGLRGVGDRLAAFDGIMTVTSPHGGPTEIRMELPCAPSSPKTSPCSATASPACSNPTTSPSSTP